MWPATLLLALAAAFPLAAGGTDPLKSPGCKLALEKLQQLESAALAAHRQPANEATDQRAAALTVKAQQRRTALACQLDTDPPAPPLASRIREPVRVSPLVLPSAVPARRALAATSPAADPRPVTLGACDEQGCWTSDGRRLTRAGSLLIGPSGFCTQQGAALRCP